MAAVRYIVNDIEESIRFYRDSLGFHVKMKAEGFAALSREDLQLFINVPGAGGRQILVEDPSGNVIELFEPAPAR